MSRNAGQLYEFGPFCLEPAEQQLLREQRPVALTPKNFDLLVYLVENHGRLITKQQIMQAVWPDSYVEEANLTVSISGLRKTLGEKEDGRQYIETVPKKGYRFTAAVTTVAIPIEESETQAVPIATDAPGPKRLRVSMIIAALVALIALLVGRVYFAHPATERPAAASTSPVSRSLAILPLQNLRHDPSNDFLGFSLTDAIITRLGGISTLSVRPSSAVQKYKDQTIDIPRVAADLDVDTLLAGNFLREGDDLRITYQLIDVKSRKILARDMIDLKYDKLLTVQDTVTREIIQVLELKLTSSEAERLAPDEPVNPLAYEYYLRGIDRMGSHEFPLAIKMLEKSAAIDARYALTWAYLGQAHNSAAAFEFGGREQYRLAQSAYERALALQPSQLETHVFLANLLIDTGKVEQAIPLLRDALRNAPNNASVHWELGYAYRFAGMLNESAAECGLARRIDPLGTGNGAVLNAYLYLGEYEKFLHSLPEDESSAFVLFYRGFAQYHRRNLEQAARDFDRAYELDPSLYTQIGKAISHAITHHPAEGLRILEQLESRIEQHGVGDPEATYKIAQAYAVLGDRTSALRMLRYSIDNGFFAYPYFITDPLLGNIRGEAQFEPIIEIARRRHEAFKSLLPVRSQ